MDGQTDKIAISISPVTAVLTRDKSDSSQPLKIFRQELPVKATTKHSQHNRQIYAKLENSSLRQMCVSQKQYRNVINILYILIIWSHKQSGFFGPPCIYIYLWDKIESLIITCRREKAAVGVRVSTVVAGAVRGTMDAKDRILSQLRSRYYAATEELQQLYGLDEYATSGIRLKLCVNCLCNWNKSKQASLFAQLININMHIISMIVTHKGRLPEKPIRPNIAGRLEKLK